MKILINNSLNNFICTASEKNILSANTNFYMNVINVETYFKKTFNVTDNSPNSCRWNNFPITLTGSSFENLSASTVYLKDEGVYNYSIFSNSASTTSNGYLVEEGQFKLSGTSITTSTINNFQDNTITLLNDTQDNIIAYE